MIKNSDLVLVSGILLTYLMFNFDSSLAFSFLAMSFVSSQLLSFDKKIDISIESRPNKVKSLLLATTGYLGVLGISSLLIEGAGFFQLNSVVQLMSEALPVLAGNQLFTFLSFAILIPFVETNFFFIRILDWVKSRFKIGSLSLTNIKVWGIIILISVAFSLFHLNAKVGLGASGFNEAMIITFVFAMISGLLVLIEGQALSALLLHIIANSVSMIEKFGWLPGINPIILAGSLAGVLLFFMNKSKINILGGTYNGS